MGRLETMTVPSPAAGAVAMALSIVAAVLHLR
jgi:hypothetical protein